MNKSIKKRIGNLETAGSKDNKEILVSWDPNPDYKNLSPGDIVITWGDDDEILSEVIKHDKANH